MKSILICIYVIASLFNCSLAGRVSCDNSLGNGDAESGVSPWVAFGSASIVTELSNHVFQVPGNTNSYFWQDVAIPPNAVTANIYAWVRYNFIPKVSY